MALQTVFKRYELKYILTRQQYEDLSHIMSEHMTLDEYGRHKISNIYFDTDDYRIIRYSLEKPKYKEKLRIRIYGEPDEDSVAFVELKKKYNGVVYKRRLTYDQKNVIEHLYDVDSHDHSSQIQKEIDYFISTYENLIPSVYLSYYREAYYNEDDPNFRMTFDFDIVMRDTDISLSNSEQDQEVLSGEYVLLEVKTVQGLPFWLIRYMTENAINKTSFSKYGTGFNQYILPKFVDGLRRA